MLRSARQSREPSGLVTLPYIEMRLTNRGDSHIGVSWNTIHAVIHQPSRNKKEVSKQHSDGNGTE